MSKEEARRLIGGYSTGSLTEAEQKALFAASLEDQELFDELADEQVLKEVVDEPGARPRLIAALEPPRHRAWSWGWAGAAATLAVAIMVVVVMNRTPAPVPQVAQVMKATEPVVEPAPVPLPTPQTAAAPARRKAVPPVEAPPPVQVQDQVQARADVAREADQVKPQAQAFGAVAPAPAVASLRKENAAASALAGFAFSYTVGADGFLEIVPAAPGYLSVTSVDQDLISRLFVNAVTLGTPVRIQIPADTKSLVVDFFRLPGGSGSPVRRDEMSGTVTDQDPPNGRIAIQLFLKPATQ